MLLKVCGLRDAGDLAAVAGLADLVGLWHEVPGGLRAAAVARLSAAALDRGLDPVLVTFAAEPLVVEGVRWVQLHGAQLPSAVARLRDRLGDGARIVQALHVRAGRGPRPALVRAYERAGVDAFLLDSATADGRLGSTGVGVPPAAALALAEELESPFLLAGGLTAANAGAYEALRAHPRFLGIDVDSGARDARGRLDAARVAALRAAWEGAHALP